jgi:hypothetical protein
MQKTHFFVGILKASEERTGIRILIDFIAKKKTMVVGNAQRKTAQKVVPISVS